MSKATKTNLTWTLFRKITEKLETEEIYLQIKNQDCYLIQSGTGQLVKVKVGDLSHTRKYWNDQWMKKFGQELAESQKEQKILAGILHELTDVEIIEELEKRITKKTIKLSRYPNQQSIYLEGKDKIKSTSVPLPVEVKKGDNHA